VRVQIVEVVNKGKMKSKRTKSVQTVSGFAFANNHAPRTVAKRLRLAGVEPERTKGRYQYFAVADMRRVMAEADAAKASPEQSAEKIKCQQLKNTLLEIEVQRALGNIAPLDICRRILTRGGTLLKTKLLLIPERTAELFSLETDANKIRERLIAEITDALRSVEAEGIEKLIKDVLADA